ncbi:response regulator transcription factor [Nocardioides donggukensis]|uniref:Helix-turn-helix transcriptional regulator n=1 Tax=Nocardioides donggukensis TaxID=2774019 RepID=A0A927K680_9ACTN|nr:helix-turn-helix transcriptional regulator [Nocardioides donggukensis]MBD8868586.1 helix-turn-helix transcriptional regulator [Nocardioides donggukensis]
MDDTRTFLDLSRRLSTRPDRPDFLAAAGRELTALFGADAVLWTEIDFGAGRVEASRDGLVDPLLAVGLARHGRAHPSILSYLAEPSDLRPRRVSDLVPDRVWRSTAVYDEVFRAVGGRFQLSLVVDLVAPVRGNGWTLLRDTGEFSDRELELARRLLPVLTTLELMYRRLPRRPVGGDGALTRREVEVLRLVSTGLKADVVGRLLGIAPSTVRKHLEHAYEKLQAHDRVSALNRARAYGLVPG